MYAKDSMDQFGDDLCKEVLSYLTLEDCFRFECVSKQWQRVVFRRQTVLSINDNLINELIRMRQLMNKFDRNSYQQFWRIFESIVKKCANISSIRFVYTDIPEDRVIDLMIKYCPHLTAISLNITGISVEAMNKFFARFGPQLETIDIYSRNGDCVEKWPLMCVNHRLFQYNHHRVLALSDLIESPVVIKRLDRLTINPNIASTEQLAVIVDRYGRQLRELSVSGAKETINVVTLLDRLVPSLSAMPALVTLNLFVIGLSTQQLVLLLTKIGVICPQLKCLRLDVRELSPQLFRTISKHFKALKRLEVLEYYGAEEPALTTDSLAPLKQLTHLKMGCYQCLDPFLHNIGHKLPNLQYLDLEFTYYTDQSFASLSALRHIRGITMRGKYESNSETAFNNLYNRPNICFIHLH